MREPIVAAPEAHSLQDFGGRVGPPSGLADQAAPAAGVHRLENAHPESAHVPDTALHLRLAQQ
eukprot:40187-Alexandrium_andersonii.AAC.1